MKGALFSRCLAGSAVALVCTTSLPAQVLLTPQAGFDITWDGNDGDSFDPASPAPVGDNLALASNGATPISSSDLGPQLSIPFHVAANLNDGLYGNANSWISADSDPGPPTYAGVLFGATVDVSAIAFGRDNGNNATDCCGGQLTDRSLGLYTLEFTTDGVNWSPIGTLEYQGNEDTAPGGGFTSYLRHRYEVSEGGGPISASGIRVVVPAAGLGAGTAIDEIEVFAAGGPPPQFMPVEAGGSLDLDNLAAAGTAFAKDALVGRMITSLNDESFGDGSAWAGAGPDSFAGISLGDLPVTVASFAFGRDNTGAQNDRALGDYTVQVTEVAGPDATTPDSDWRTIGIVSYQAGSPPDPHLRHRFNIGARLITGLRLLTPDGAAIDELELYATPYIPPPPPALTITPAAGFTASWDGNDGDFFNPDVPDLATPTYTVPENLARTDQGGAPFASGVRFSPTHQVAQLNDGFYGNANSWIGGPDAPAFAGIALPGPTALSAIAWGRDNGNGAFDDSVAGSDACGGQCDDRSLGTYTVQITTVANPDAFTPDGDWLTVAEFSFADTGPGATDDSPGGVFTEWLRHQFAIGDADGKPILATGIRIVVPNIDIAIDEIELYGPSAPPVGPSLQVSYERGTDELLLSWESRDGMLYTVRSEADPAASPPTAWPIFAGHENLAATPPLNTVRVPLPAEALRLFVVEEFPAPPMEIFGEDFESGAPGWLAGSEGLDGTAWELGSPGAPGPAAAHGGNNCYGTNLTAEYGIDANVWLRSPEVDLSTAGAATLSFYQFRDIEAPGPPVYDYGTVTVLDAANDAVLEVMLADLTGTSPGWELRTLPVPAAALGRRVMFEFRFQSDDVQTYAGWYIDDLSVTVP